MVDSPAGPSMAPVKLLDVSRAGIKPRTPTRLAVEFPPDFDILQPPRQIVHGLITAGSLVLLYGESNCGKSTIAIDIGMAVARGTDWRGRRTRQGLVLHIAGEGTHGVRARINGYLQHHVIAPDGIPYGVTREIDLTNDIDVADLTDQIAEIEAIHGKLALLIFDTLARCAAIDENDGADMRKVIAACDRLREATTAAICLVHHAGKDLTKGARGHSSLRAAVDTEILIEGPSNPRRLSVTKQRDLPAIEPVAFELLAVTIGQDHEAHEALTAVVVQHENVELPQRRPSGSRQNQLLAALEVQAEDGVRIWTDTELRRLGRTLGMSKASARSAVLGLTSAGYLTGGSGGLRLTSPGGDS